MQGRRRDYSEQVHHLYRHLHWPEGAPHDRLFHRNRKDGAMTINASYGQFCPVAMAAEIVCTRWTPLVLRELLAGSTRFNQLRKGVPLMSPALLSKRLKELEEAGLIRRSQADPKIQEYLLTEAGEELEPLILALGFWGQRWVESQVSLKNLDPSPLMWDLRRHLHPTPLPEPRFPIHIAKPSRGDR